MDGHRIGRGRRLYYAIGVSSRSLIIRQPDPNAAAGRVKPPSDEREKNQTRRPNHRVYCIHLFILYFLFVLNTLMIIGPDVSGIMPIPHSLFISPSPSFAPSHTFFNSVLFFYFSLYIHKHIKHM